MFPLFPKENCCTRKSAICLICICIIILQHNLSWQKRSYGSVHDRQTFFHSTDTSSKLEFHSFQFSHTDERPYIFLTCLNPSFCCAVTSFICKAVEWTVRFLVSEGVTACIMSLSKGLELRFHPKETRFPEWHDDRQNATPHPCFVAIGTHASSNGVEFYCEQYQFYFRDNLAIGLFGVSSKSKALGVVALNG